MQWLVDYLNSLGDSPVALWIAESTWAFPALEVVHIFAISTVFGTIAIIDLRLLGLASTKRPYSEMARELLPWTWGAFFLAAICGSVLILSRPAGYFENIDFRLKFVCMALAFANMIVFQFITSKSLANWDRGARPVAARVAGAVSILMWIGVVYFARMTGFTMVQGGAYVAATPARAVASPRAGSGVSGAASRHCFAWWGVSHPACLD
jgi:hypothetical protein